MKEAAVRNSAAGLPAVNSPLNDSGRVNAPSTQREANTETGGPAALEERRERTHNHRAKLAARRESWINRNKYYYELLNRLFRFLVEAEKKGLPGRCGTGKRLAVDRA